LAHPSAFETGVDTQLDSAHTDPFVTIILVHTDPIERLPDIVGRSRQPANIGILANGNEVSAADRNSLRDLASRIQRDDFGIVKDEFRRL
jgi:hypothetical protein